MLAASPPRLPLQGQLSGSTLESTNALELAVGIWPFHPLGCLRYAAVLGECPLFPIVSAGKYKLEAFF